MVSEHLSFACFQTVKDLKRVCKLWTIDPRSHKVQTKPYKIPKFDVNPPNSKQNTAIWKCQILQRNVWPSGRCVQNFPYISLLIMMFLNRYLSQN